MPQFLQYFTEVTSLDAAVGLPVIGGTSEVVLQSVGGVVAWRDDGSNPTASSGFVLADGAAPMSYSRGSMKNLRFIKVSGTPTLKIAYYSSRKTTVCVGGSSPSIASPTMAAAGTVS